MKCAFCKKEINKDNIEIWINVGRNTSKDGIVWEGMDRLFLCPTCNDLFTKNSVFYRNFRKYCEKVYSKTNDMSIIKMVNNDERF